MIAKMVDPTAKKETSNKDVAEAPSSVLVRLQDVLVLRSGASITGAMVVLVLLGLISRAMVVVTAMSGSRVNDSSACIHKGDSFTSVRSIVFVVSVQLPEIALTTRRLEAILPTR
jgi:hypothetical protein